MYCRLVTNVTGEVFKYDSGRSEAAGAEATS